MPVLKVVLMTNSEGEVVFNTGCTVLGKMNDAGPTTVTLTETPSESGIYQVSVSEEGIYHIWVDGADTGLQQLIGKANGNDIQALVIDTGHLAADSVTNAKIAASAVDTEQLAADAVIGTKIADDAIDSEHIAAGAIDNEHLAAGCVSENKLNDEVVTGGKIAADAVNGTKIADDAIDSEHIAAGAIDEEHYADGSITQAKLNSSAYSEAAAAGRLVKRDENAAVKAQQMIIEDLNGSGASLITKCQSVTKNSDISGTGEFTITLDDIDPGDKVIACAIRINEALGQTWSAAYNQCVDSQTIAAAGQANAINTKVKAFFDPNTDSPIVTSEMVDTGIKITADSGTFTGGSVTVWVFYQTIAEPDDIIA
jgi:hypothetical protein